MMIALPIMLIAAQSATTPAPTPVAPSVTAPVAQAPKPDSSPVDRYQHCVTLATDDPKNGELEATFWLRDGGTFQARQCLGMALANQDQWAPAAQEFETAAKAAEVAHDARAATYWSQAGNSWLAAADFAHARAALDAALAAGSLDPVQRGETAFDRARALVAINDLAGARTDIDTALSLVKEDALIWLASATLARKMNDLPRAKHDIAEAFNRASDDPSVFLEVGNIAAAGGDAEGARTAWKDAVRVGPDSEAGAFAQRALAQFDEKPAANPQ